jgi:hypothetical protein
VKPAPCAITRNRPELIETLLLAEARIRIEMVAGLRGTITDPNEFGRRCRLMRWRGLRRRRRLLCG